MTRDALDAGYYQALHETNPAFQNNNWMVQDLDRLRSYGGVSLLELGCGNGVFLELAGKYWTRVLGVDWARAPGIDAILERSSNVAFEQADALEWRPEGRYDVVASADFLEHLPPERLVAALRRFHGFGEHHYHRIACYDDGHSHLSILAPEQWLELFDEAAFGEYRLLSNEARKGDASKRVITIGTT